MVSGDGARVGGGPQVTSGSTGHDAVADDLLGGRVTVHNDGAVHLCLCNRADLAVNLNQGIIEHGGRCPCAGGQLGGRAGRGT